MPFGHIDKMDLKHLRFFAAAVEEGSLLRAAERLNIAQPALTRRMQDLEVEFGCALLKRGPRGVSATPAGLALYRDTVALIDELNGIVENTRRIGIEQERELRVGIAPSASRKYGFIQRALARSQQGAAIAFVPGASIDLANRVREGDCDIALLFEQIPSSPQVQSRLIHSERYILAIYHSHRLATPGAIDLCDISGEGLVWLSRRDLDGGSNPLMQQLRLRGMEPAITHLVADTSAQLDLVAAGAGICLTPASTMLSVPAGQFCFRPIRDFNMLLEFRLAWKDAPGFELLASLLTEFDAEIAKHQDKIASGTIRWTQLYGERLIELPTPLSHVEQRPSHPIVVGPDE